MCKAGGRNRTLESAAAGWKMCRCQGIHRNQSPNPFSPPAFPSLSSTPYYWSLIRSGGQGRIVRRVLCSALEDGVQKSGFGAEAMTWHHLAARHTPHS